MQYALLDEIDSAVSKKSRTKRCLNIDANQ